MDPHGHIYRDDPKNIPAEDKARLEGYLIARAEADERARLGAQMAAISDRLKLDSKDRA